MACLRAETGKAFTTVRAGLALTMQTLPNISRLPAFVAFFVRVSTRTMPGTITLPVFFKFAATTSAKADKTVEQSDFFKSHAVARASASPPLVTLLAPLRATMAFMAFFMAFMGAMSLKKKKKVRNKVGGLTVRTA